MVEPTLVYVDAGNDELAVTAVQAASEAFGAVPVVALAITSHHTDEPACVCVPLADVDRLVAAILSARDEAGREHR